MTSGPSLPYKSWARLNEFDEFHKELLRQGVHPELSEKIAEAFKNFMLGPAQAEYMNMVAVEEQAVRGVNTHRITLDTTAPSDPEDGDLWIDTT